MNMMGIFRGLLEPPVKLERRGLFKGTSLHTIPSAAVCALHRPMLHRKPNAQPANMHSPARTVELCPKPFRARRASNSSKVVLILFVGSLAACRLDTDALTIVDQLARDVPDIVIQNVIYKEKENNLVTQEIYADQFRVFSNQDLVEVRQGKVKTYRDGQAQLSGQAVAAQYNQETEDASVTGPIEVYYHPEETRVKAQQLDWNHQERRLLSPEDSVVEVEQDNGTQFQGSRFTVDMSTKTVSYGKDVSGKLYVQNEAETRETQERETASAAEPGGGATQS